MLGLLLIGCGLGLVILLTIQLLDLKKKMEPD